VELGGPAATFVPTPQPRPEIVKSLHEGKVTNIAYR